MQQHKYIKLKEADLGQQSFSKITGSGSGSFSKIRIRMDPNQSKKSGS